MKMIFQIAKTELKTLFCSPIAWMILIIFAVQVGFSFSGLFENIMSRQLLGYWNTDISRSLFASTNPQGTLQLVQNYLFLYIPLLTMSLMHHERQTGSMSLLYSSPISSGHIVLGKYVALLVVDLAFVVILACQGVYCYFIVVKFDVVYFLVALLGVFLLIAAYSAVGLFMACVIRYPIAAAIATMAILLLLGYVGEWWQDVPGVSQMAYWLSIKNRLTPIISGLLCSEDFLYFLVVVLLFVGLSILYVYFSRRTVSLVRRLASYTALFVAAFCMGWLSCQPRLMSYFDATYMKVNSLLPQHQDILRRLEGPLKITSYCNLLSEHGKTILPTTILNDKKYALSDYIRFKPDIETEYVFYYNNPQIINPDTMRQIARKVAIQYDQDFRKYISPEELAKRIDLSDEDYEMVRVLEDKDGKQVRLRLFNDMAVIPGESEWMAAFKRLAMPLPRVGFVTGHGERSVQSNQNRDICFMARQNNYRGALTNQGFEVVEKELCKDSLDDIQILMIVDGTQPFTEKEQEVIRNYLEKGGNACLLADTDSKESMQPLLQMVGMTLSDHVLTQHHDGEKPSLLLTQTSTEAARLDSAFHWMRVGGELISMPNALALKCGEQRMTSTFKMTPLVVNTDSTWVDGTLSSDSLMLACGLTRTISDKEQRIIVAGDCDWLSNGELQSVRPGIRTTNSNLIKNVFSWLSYGEVPIDSSRKIGPDGMFTVNKHSYVLLTKIIFCGIIPLVLLITGTAILFRRKNK